MKLASICVRSTKIFKVNSKYIHEFKRECKRGNIYLSP